MSSFPTDSFPYFSADIFKFMIRIRSSSLTHGFYFGVNKAQRKWVGFQVTAFPFFLLHLIFIPAVYKHAKDSNIGIRDVTIIKPNKSTAGMEGKSIHVLPCQLITVAQKKIHATHYHQRFMPLTTTIHATHYRNTTKGRE